MEGNRSYTKCMNWERQRWIMYLLLVCITEVFDLLWILGQSKSKKSWFSHLLPRKSSATHVLQKATGSYRILINVQLLWGHLSNSIADFATCIGKIPTTEHLPDLMREAQALVQKVADKCPFVLRWQEERICMREWGGKAFQRGYFNGFRVLLPQNNAYSCELLIQ